MANTGISVPYNRSLSRLETALSEVRRPGDFFVQGVIETPMPRVEVEGTGVLSFPLPEFQIRQLIEQATRAPYGRGEETVYDDSVRKTWQLPASHVQISGKAWEKTFPQILATVVNGLGCADAKISAELYKLLIYDRGAFFKSHRDTEKAGGMFGTLVVVLPSAHHGGDLVIRHAGREVILNLSSDEFSELKFAAFYADCEHEVQPVSEGYRVGLVYNLIQRGTGEAESQPLRAPLYTSEINAAARMLKDAFDDPASPAKLAWLLEHQYSPAGLSFAGLKGRDAALGRVLRAAAERADCAVHLGIVHIQETGPAQPTYESGGGYGRRGRWGGYENEYQVSDDRFEVIEVSGTTRHIDQWMNERDESIAYGQLPLEDGEVLPADALDKERPDDQRVMEATGNEGATFERSYHRAALVMWPRDRFAAVLVQSGAGAALPHLAARLAAGDKSCPAIAERIIEAWERPRTQWMYRSRATEPNRGEMLQLLTRLGAPDLLNRFVSGVVTNDFDGSESDALAKALISLDSQKGEVLLVNLLRANSPLFPGACVRLGSLLVSELGDRLDTGWRAVLRQAATELVRALSSIERKDDLSVHLDWRRAQKVMPVDARMLANLLEFLQSVDDDKLRMQAATQVAADSAVFDPGTVIVPALELIHQRERQGFTANAAAKHLWVHAAEFILARSKNPPAAPTDWRQPVTLPCNCEDCRELQAFARDAQRQMARFSVRMDRRAHLEAQIQQHGLDITHMTERKGRPQTLVCTKNRRSFQRQCEQHRADCAAMNVLLELMRPSPAELSTLTQRLTAAKELNPRA